MSGAEAADSLVCFAACGVWKWGYPTAVRYANVLLAMPKDPACPARRKAPQTTPSSIARAVWCGSGMVVDGKTKCSGADVADGLVWIAACGYSGGLSPR